MLFFSLSYTLWIMPNFIRLTLLSTMLLAILTCRVQFVPLTETTQATHHTHNFTFSWMLLALLETGNSPLTQKFAHAYANTLIHSYTRTYIHHTLTHTNVHIYLYMVVYISRFLRLFCYIPIFGQLLCVFTTIYFSFHFLFLCVV